MTGQVNAPTEKRSHASFQEALEDVLYRSRIPMKEIAYRMGIPESTMRGWASDSSRNRPKAEDLARLTIASGNPALIEYEARRAGGIYVPMLNLTELPVAELEAVLEATGDLSAIGQVAVQKARTGRVDPDTAALVAARAHRLIAKILSISAALTSASGCAGLMTT